MLARLFCILRSRKANQEVYTLEIIRASWSLLNGLWGP